MPRRRMKVNRPILPILTLNWLPWQCPVSDRKTRVQSVIYDKMLTCGENLVKIGQVDPDIISLTGLF